MAKMTSKQQQRHMDLYHGKLKRPAVPKSASERYTTSKYPKLAKVLREWTEAERKLGQTVRDTFPVGAEVSWMHGDRIRSGVVISHGGFGNRVKVLTDPGGKEVWRSALSFRGVW